MVLSNDNQKLMVVFEAISMKDFEKHGVSSGDKIFASLMPSFRYYLSKSGRVGYGFQSEIFETWGKENIDFIRI